MAKVDPLVWYNNFKNSVAELIAETKAEAHRVEAIAMTDDIFRKCTEALGYEPDNLFGYKIEVVELSLLEEAENKVGIVSHPIQ